MNIIITQKEIDSALQEANHALLLNIYGKEGYGAYWMQVDEYGSCSEPVFKYNDVTTNFFNKL